MDRKHVYRGFLIRIEQDGSGFRPHFCESLEHCWASGNWASTVKAAADQARANIDLRYQREAEEFDLHAQRNSKI